jgi:GNAT superfamily N-acetyltransferase
MTANLEKAFESKRLIYRAVEDNDADKNWFHTQVQNDPTAFCMSEFSVLRPQVKSRNDEKLAEMAKYLLGVIICLKPTAAAAGGGGGGGEGEKTSTSTSSTPSPTPIGYISLDNDGGPNYYRYHHRDANLCVALVREYRGRGYGTEAVAWATNWAFSRAGMHSVNLGCVEFNTHGIALYEKLGFISEGRGRKCHFHDGAWWDVCLYSMLEEDWLRLRAEKKGIGITLS